MPHTPAAYLTAALRSRLIRATVNDSNATDIVCFLAELGLEPPPENSREYLCQYLLSQMAHWAKEPQNTEKLIRCCEGLAQFYLLEAETAPEMLEQLNAHLPQGLRFSLISGRLLLDHDIFFAPHNPFFEETPYLDRTEPKHISPQIQSPLPDIPDSAASPGAEQMQHKAPIETMQEPPLDRQNERQRIVSQRMNMLKNQLSGRTGS